MPGPRPRLLALFGALLATAGCSSEGEFTADVAGHYRIALTNRTSSCSFAWAEGNQAEDVGLAITQDGSKLHGVVDGLAGGFLTLWLGSAEFDGSANGTSLTLTNYGTNPQADGNCAFTYNAVVDGEISGDAIAGTITYSPATNAGPDCASVECSAVQEFSGSRPPK